MASTRAQRWGPRAALAGDAGLLTAAAAGWALVPGALEPGVSGLLGSVLLWAGIAALLFLPLLAWWIHGRPADGTATLGAIVGFAVGAAVVFGALWLVVIARAIFGASNVVLGGSDLGVPWVMVAGVAVVVVAYLVGIAWLDVDALRDLLRRRTHVWLDVLRLLATVAYVAVLVEVFGWFAGSPAPEVDRVPILVFLLAPGVMGAAAATGADLLVRNHEKHSRAQLITHA